MTETTAVAVEDKIETATEVEATADTQANQSNGKKLKKKRGLNSGTISGLIEKSELKKSGSYEIWVNTDTTRKDTPMKGSGDVAHFTSVLFIRVPKPIVDRVGKGPFEEGKEIIVPLKMVGVRRIAVGQAYDLVELRAADAIPVN